MQSLPCGQRLGVSSCAGEGGQEVKFVNLPVCVPVPVPVPLSVTVTVSVSVPVPVPVPERAQDSFGRGNPSQRKHLLGMGSETTRRYPKSRNATAQLNMTFATYPV